MKLTEAGKEEFALAILLWKDFKCDGKMDMDVAIMAHKMAQHVGVEKEFSDMMSKLPPVKIVPRYDSE